MANVFDRFKSLPGFGGGRSGGGGAGGEWPESLPNNAKSEPNSLGVVSTGQGAAQGGQPSSEPSVCQFKFQIIPGGPTVEFPAYLNSFGSRFTPSWNEYQEIGRADPKILMSSYSKEVDFDFTVVAENPGDRNVDNIFKKLEDLSKASLPNYFPGNQGFQGNFVRFTICRIYKDEVGYIVNLQYQWENDKTSWIDNLPILGRVNMTVKWIGNKMPQSSARTFSF